MNDWLDSWSFDTDKVVQSDNEIEELLTSEKARKAVTEQILRKMDGAENLNSEREIIFLSDKVAATYLPENYDRSHKKVVGEIQALANAVAMEGMESAGEFGTRFSYNGEYMICYGLGKSDFKEKIFLLYESEVWDAMKQMEKADA